MTRDPGKQPVVIVHGMGEQRPMDTLRGFVRTMWEQDATIARGQGPGRTQVWSRFDARTGSLELRRITTRASYGGGHYPPVFAPISTNSIGPI